MTGPARVTVRIGNLRVQGATQAEAQALASALSESLAAQLTADPSRLRGAGAENLSVTLPSMPARQPAVLGQAAGQHIASALGAKKGGT